MDAIEAERVGAARKLAKAPLACTLSQLLDLANWADIWFVRKVDRLTCDWRLLQVAA